MTPIPMFPLLLLCCIHPISAVHLTDSALGKVYNVMNQISTRSWENGTKAEAMLEYTYPSYSVFSPTPPLPLPSSLSASSIQSIVDVAQVTMQNRPSTNTSAGARGGSSLLSDGAAGDPASLGIAVLLANATDPSIQIKGVTYGAAATAELNYLLYDVPKTSTGAISHRADQAQLWSDSVYMVPPFLAYYGAVNNNGSLIELAYNQISLYRNALRTSSGLWQHIVQGNGTSDPGLWLTGNAWVAAGITRVLATIIQSGQAGNLPSQMDDLQEWAEEILSASQGYMTSNGLLRNYINDGSSFEDSAGSTLMAAAGLRLATLNLTDAHVNMSLTLLSATSAKVNSTGYLQGVVDPNSFSAQANASPEGQSFMILAYAAYKEWAAQGSPGGNSAGLGSDSEAGRLGGNAWLLGLAGMAVGLLWTIA